LFDNSAAVGRASIAAGFHPAIGRKTKLTFINHIRVQDSFGWSLTGFGIPWRDTMDSLPVSFLGGVRVTNHSWLGRVRFPKIAREMHAGPVFLEGEAAYEDMKRLLPYNNPAN